MNPWSMVAIVAVVGGAIVVAGIFKPRPLERETFTLRFAVCEHALDLSFKCEPCFAGKQQPLCPEDARVMMVMPK